jgi:chorismate mutase
VSVRGVRGAVTVARDDREEVLAATGHLLDQMLSRNSLSPDDVISAVFTATPDLRSCFPAEAARRAGWADVPLLDAVEIDVPGALERCVRVLLHVETSLDRSAVQHVYLGEARTLRDDLA